MENIVAKARPLARRAFFTRGFTLYSRRLVMSRNRSAGRRTAPPRTCLFCGMARPLNGEHIFGDWLRKLGFTGEGVREIIPGDGSTPIIQRGGPFSKKLKVVCYPCNSEWMSGMETAA